MFSRPTYSGSANDRLAQKSILAFVSRTAPGLATFTVNLLIGRLGGTALLGTTQGIMSSASLLALTYPTPASSAASKFIAASNAGSSAGDSQTVARYLSNRVALATAVLAVIAAVAHYFSGTSDTSLAAISALMVVGISVRIFVDGLHFGSGLGARLAAWSSAVAIISAVTTIILLLAGVRSAWLITPLAFLNIIFAVLSWPRRQSTRLAPALRKNIRRFVLLGIAGTLASAGFAQAAVLVNVAANGLDFTGQYAGAMTLTTPIALVASALGAVLFPALAASFQTHDNTTIRNRVETTTRLLMSALIPVLIVFTTLAEPIVMLVWGEQFQATTWILLFLVPSIICTAIASPAVSALTAASNRGMAISALSSISGAIVGALVWIICTPISPQIAVPAGYAAGVSVIAGVPWLITWRQFQMSWLKETAILIGAIALSVGVSYFLQTTDQSWYLALVASIILTGFWIVLRRRDMTALVKLITRQR